MPKHWLEKGCIWEELVQNLTICVKRNLFCNRRPGVFYDYKGSFHNRSRVRFKWKSGLGGKKGIAGWTSMQLGVRGGRSRKMLREPSPQTEMFSVF